MTTQTITMKFPSNASLFPIWTGEKYIGRRVSFKLCGHIIAGRVTATKKVFLCNGIHDILEIEPEGERKQVKINLHRQAVTLLEE